MDRRRPRGIELRTGSPVKSSGAGRSRRHEVSSGRLLRARFVRRAMNEMIRMVPPQRGQRSGSSCQTCRMSFAHRMRLPLRHSSSSPNAQTAVWFGRGARSCRNGFHSRRRLGAAETRPLSHSTVVRAWRRLSIPPKTAARYASPSDSRFAATNSQSISVSMKVLT